MNFLYTVRELEITAETNEVVNVSGSVFLPKISIY